MIEGLVSVIIPTHGRAEFLSKSIESVVRQNYDQIEIVVVDDNGKNTPVQLDTADGISKINCRFPINYIVNEENEGGAASRNRGAESARGEFLSFLDDDDEYEPQRISRQLSLLLEASRNDKLVKACTSLVIRKKYGKEIDRQGYKFNRNYLVDLLALKSSLYTGSTLLMYTDVFFALEGFDTSFRRNQDLEFMIRFFQKYNIIVINEHLTILNLEDRSHIPSYGKILETKTLFLNKFKPVILSLTEQQQKLIYQNNALEIAKVALWNKNKFGFLKGVRQANLSIPELYSFGLDVIKKSIMHLK